MMISCIPISSTSLLTLNAVTINILVNSSLQMTQVTSYGQFVAFPDTDIPLTCKGMFLENSIFFCEWC